MTVRKVLQSIATVVIFVGFVVGGVFTARQLAGLKPDLPKVNHSGAATVFTKKVENGSVPVNVKATGALQALNRVDLFAEVQGVMQPDGGKFKPGNRFSKGQTLVSVNSADFEANLISQRSNLQNLITSALADIRLDFPESFEKWNAYTAAFNVNEMVPALPAPGSDQEKMFISGRQILSTYYAIRNAEIVLGKYNLSAPFNGVLTETMVTPGTVIRPGQKLGSFIDPTVFELEVAIPNQAVHLLKIGQKVGLNPTSDIEYGWMGTVSRINQIVDPTTQTINAYILVEGDGDDNIQEGVYLEAVIAAKEVEAAVELPREMLFDDNQVYITDGKELIKSTVEPIYFTENTVIVRGLKDGNDVLVKMPPSAYPGMEVTKSPN